jgi:DNA segregation ATPase FtsK/SpoIIIE, S-DNA-T family
MDLRSNIRDLIGGRLELKLGDAGDSIVGRRQAMNLPSLPGHGLTPGAMHFLGALPRIDGSTDPASLAPALAELVAAVRGAWGGAAAPAVRMLPDRLPYASLPTPSREGCRLPIGVGEADLAPVELDLGTEPHLIVFGDVECGKSTLLRTIAARLVERYQAAEARIILVDYRRSLLEAVAPEYLLAYGTSSQSTTQFIADVVTAMRRRLPGPDVTAEQLRTRSWWQGPELFILVDDYDMVASGSTNPLTPLVEFVPQARDIGLHIIVTRRIGGASRALFDPLIARMRESAAPGLMMSGSKDEGPLFGNLRPQPLPPGRGWLTSRRGNQLIQLAWRDPLAE